MKVAFVIALIAGGLLGSVPAFATLLQPTNTPPVVPPSPTVTQAPSFYLPPLPGYKKGLDSADFRGKVRIVNVFASWSLPCRTEAPVLMRLAKAVHVPILGIDQKDKPEDALAYLNDTGNPYVAIGMDSDKRVSKEWGAYGTPETFVVDTEGRIRFKQAAPLTWQDIEKTIMPLLRELKVK